MADAEDEDYHFYGTPIEDEQEGKSSAYRRPVKDPAQLRTLPVWKQEATDEKGRKRFHGAFTGGYSAGHYNTVGSAEGFQPASFKSSRNSRQTAVQQSVEDFLDEDELEERNRTVLTVKDDYDTFGTTTADAARNVAQREAQQRPSLIPGPVIEEIVVPVANGVGMRLLQKLGWRPGRGVGTAAPSRQAKETGSKWGSVAGVSLENTPLYVLEPKEDLHGLGYDPFAGAEEFRQAAKRRKVAERSGPGGSGSAWGTTAGAGTGGDAAKDRADGAPAAQRRGRIAFGTGALEETDTFGYMADYVEDDYDEPHQLNAGGSGAGMQGRKGLTGAAVGALGSSGGVRVARNWERLALSYEVVSEGESDDGHGGRAGPGRRRPPLLLEPGSKGGPPLLLQARGHGRAPDSLIPGFLPSRSSSASGVVVSDFFPPPEVPQDFSGRHVFARGLRAGGLLVTLAAAAAAGAVGAVGAPLLPPPPEVPPPSDPDLRREIEGLAAMVARSGPALEDIARKQAIAAAGPAARGAEGGDRRKYSFFVTGQGLPYYLWRLHRIQTALAAVNAGPQRQTTSVAASAATAPLAGSATSGPTGSAAHRAAGGRPEPLTVEQRMAMLGEQPLPVTAATGPAGMAAASVAAAEAPPPRLQVAEADRRHLQALLNSSFVRGETQDLSTESRSEPALVGLNLGGKQAAAAAAAAAAFLSRFTSGSSTETAVLQPDGEGGLQQQQKGGKEGGGGKDGGSAACQRQEPVRSAEDWRPEPLLCKRFNVPDPYKGKPPPQQVSRFRTDFLALPETNNLVISPTANTAALTVGVTSSLQQQAGDTSLLPLPPPQTALPAPPASGSIWGGMGPTSLTAAPAAPAAIPPVNSLPGSNLLPPPPLTQTRPGSLPGSQQLPLPGPPLPPPPPWRQHPSSHLVARSDQKAQPVGQPMGAPQSNNTSALDAASAFLSTFGQSLLGPDGGSSGVGVDRTAPPPLPSIPRSLNMATQPAHTQSQLPLPPPPAVALAHDSKDVAIDQNVSSQALEISHEEDLAVLPLEKPLDLFAAIFEAESDAEDEEVSDAAKSLQVEQQTNDVVGVNERDGHVKATGNAGGPAKSLAEALMRAQEVSSKRAQEARESRQAAALQEQLTPGDGLQNAPAGATGGSTKPPGGILGTVDPEVQERIRAALGLYQRHHRSKDRDKDRKRKKGKDREKQKDRRSKKDKKRKDKDRDRDRGRVSKKRRKDGRTEKNKKRKKDNMERKERRGRKSARRWHGTEHGEGGGDDDAQWKEFRGEDRGSRKEKEAEEGLQRARKRKRVHSNRHNNSSSSDDDGSRDDRLRCGGQGADELPGASLGPAAGPAAYGYERQHRGDGLEGRLPSTSDNETDSSSETGDGSSSSSSDGDSDSRSESR